MTNYIEIIQNDKMKNSIPFDTKRTFDTKMLSKKAFRTYSPLNNDQTIRPSNRIEPVANWPCLEFRGPIARRLVFFGLEPNTKIVLGVLVRCSAVERPPIDRRRRN